MALDRAERVPVVREANAKLKVLQCEIKRRRRRGRRRRRR